MAKKMILLLLVLVTTFLGTAPCDAQVARQQFNMLDVDDDLTEVIARLHTIQQKLRLAQVQPVASYAALLKQSMSENRPLVVFVGVEPFNVPGCLTHDAGKKFGGVTGPVIVVSVPHGNDSYYVDLKQQASVADIHAAATQLRGQLNRPQAQPQPYAQPQPQARPAYFNGGGFRFGGGGGGGGRC